jgi:Cu/Ag efflux protein CusF
MRLRSSAIIETISKQLVLSVVITMVAGQIAHAQAGGGHGGGHRGQGKPSSGGSTPVAAPAVAPTVLKPQNQIEIVGVVRAIDLNAKRITIAYDAVDALNWPRGTMPFSVYRATLLQGVTVGEKVRFKLDSQRISELKPF